MAGPSLAVRPRRLDTSRAFVVALSVVALAWAAVVVAIQLGLVRVPGPRSLGIVLGLLGPALGLAFVSLRRGNIPRGAGWVVGLTVLVPASLAVATLILYYPLYSLGVFALAATSVLALARPSLAVAGLLILSGAYGSLVAFWTVPVNGLTHGLVAGLLGALVVRIASERRDPLQPSLPVWLLVAYLGLAAITIPLAASPMLAVKGFAISPWYIVVALAIGLGGWSVATQQRMARLVVLAALAVGAYATLRWRIGPAAQELVNTSSNNVVGGQLKTFGSLPTGQALGSWVTTVIPFCAAAVLTWRGRWWRVLAGLAIVVCVIALFASELRIGLVAAVVGLAVTACLFHAARSIPGLHLGSTGIAIATATFVVVAAFFVTGSNQAGPAHSYSSVFRPLEDESIQQRLAKWKQGLVEARGYPFGHGLGSASFTTARATGYYGGVGYLGIDNGYLKVALEQGYAVMILYIAALGSLLVALGRAAIRLADRRAAGLAMGAAGSLAAMTVLLTLLTPLDEQRAAVLWVIVGLGIAQLVTPPKEPEEPAAEAGPY